MSEVLHCHNEELYHDLGIDELMKIEVPPEDPRLQTGENTSLRTAGGFIRYFESRDSKDSPTYGYGHLAREFCGQLDQIFQYQQDYPEGTINGLCLAVNLRPGLLPPTEIFNKLEPRQHQIFLDALDSRSKPLYEFEQDSASRAFRGAIDLLLHAKDPSTSALWEDSVLYKARFHNPDIGTSGQDTHLWLMETIKQDELANFSQLELRSQPPPGFQPRELVMAPLEEHAVEKQRTPKQERLLRRKIARWNGIIERYLDLDPAAQKHVTNGLPEKIGDIGIIEGRINKVSPKKA